VSQVLEIRGVSSGYGEAIILRDVSLTITEGEIFALLGKNGMGKSTLLKTALGFLRARSGAIHLLGQDVTGLEPYKVARLSLAYSPQEGALFQELTVEENLRLVQPAGRRLQAGIERISEYFPIISQRLDQKAGTLSGGEQKMLIISRALLVEPHLILIDEISEGLQPSVIDRLADILRRERQRTGVSILLVEQNVSFALSVADRYAILKIGEIAAAGRVTGPETAASVHAHLRI
jgi:ABC-type branched-subunit amino acid transport system ATPase component